MFEGLRALFDKKATVRSKGGGGAAPKTAPKAVPRSKAKRINLGRRFTIVGEAGQGSMSKVLRAVDNDTGRVVCLKLQDRAKTAAVVARSRQAGRPTEGEVGLRIVHPHVVRTLEWGETAKGEGCIVMEFIEGMGLTAVRESRGLALADKLELLAQAAEALAAVHAAGFIHHDFGPKNLLVTADSRIKLIDFGLSVPNTPAFRRPGNRIGTLRYMAPEVMRREAKDETLDIFSWGATAFEFLSGKLPDDAGIADPMAIMRTRINSEPMPLERLAPHLPAELCGLVNRTLIKNPRDRWPEAATLADALRALPVALR